METKPELVDVIAKQKSWRTSVNKAKAVTLAKALELKGIKICSGSAEGGRIGFGKGTKCGTALAADNHNLYMKLAQTNKAAMKLFKSGQIGKYLKAAKNWAGKNMGPAGWIGGELLAIGLGGAYEMSQGKGWKEALGSWTLLGGLGEKYSKERLEEIGKEQGWSEKQVYDALKYGKLLQLDLKAHEKEQELEGLLEQQDIGGTARVKYNPKILGAHKPTQGQYQDPKSLRNLKEEVGGIWDEGDALWNTLMNPDTSAALFQELQDRKRLEELNRKNKLRSIMSAKPLGIGQQMDVDEIPFYERKFQPNPNEAAFTSFDPYTEYAGGGIAAVRRPDAIPPRSGPMPDGGGLSTMFNRARTW